MAGSALTELQRVVAEGEQRDRETYALGKPGRARALHVRPCVAALLVEGDVSGLGPIRARLAIAVDARVMTSATLAEEREARGDDAAGALLKLFARKELLARRAGRSGYVELALAADGLTAAGVASEIEAAERRARRGAGIRLDEHVDWLPGEVDVWVCSDALRPAGHGVAP